MIGLELKYKPLPPTDVLEGDSDAPLMEIKEPGLLTVIEPPSETGEPVTVTPFAPITVMFELARLAFGMPVGRSAVIKLRNAGVAGEPLAGPAKAVFAFWLDRVTPKVPEDVMGEPLMLNMDGTVMAIEEITGVPELVKNNHWLPDQ